jgi:hypothetical protein
MPGREQFELRRFKIIGPFVLLAVVLLIAQWHHPPEGCAISREGREFARLKNRTRLPQAQDFDERVTLPSLLQGGGDAARWSNTRAAALEGYVVEVKEGAIETANCFSLLERDTHIDLALKLDAPQRARVILEVSPGMRAWAGTEGLDWSTNSLKRELVGHLCRFQGWLLFDQEHADNSENTAPSNQKNWRATAWELHPLTDIKVVN